MGCYRRRHFISHSSRNRHAIEVSIQLARCSEIFWDGARDFICRFCYPCFFFDECDEQRVWVAVEGRYFVNVSFWDFLFGQRDQEI